MQKFFENNLENKLVKAILANTEMPTYPAVVTGDYIINKCIYCYEDKLIQCTKTGILTNNYIILDTYNFKDYYVGHTNIYKSNYNYYDTETHEQLGKYLRLYHTYTGINLMPFYNCYSVRHISNISFNKRAKIERKKDIIVLSTNTNICRTTFCPIIGDLIIKKDSTDIITNYTADKNIGLITFNETYAAGTEISIEYSYKVTSFEMSETADDSKKIIAVPILFDRLYTIALDSSSSDIFIQAAIYRSGLIKQVNTVDGVTENLNDLLENCLIKAKLNHTNASYSNKSCTKTEFFNKTYQEQPDYIFIKPKNINIKNIISITINQEELSPEKYSIDTATGLINVNYLIEAGVPLNIKLIYEYLESKTIDDSFYSIKNKPINLSNITFNKPILYSINLNTDTLTDKEKQKLHSLENYLYLIIQMPKTLETSIAVLEGDYLKKDVSYYYNFEKNTDINIYNELYNKFIEKNEVGLYNFINSNVLNKELNFVDTFVKSFSEKNITFTVKLSHRHLKQINSVIITKVINNSDTKQKLPKSAYTFNSNTGLLTINYNVYSGQELTIDVDYVYYDTVSSTSKDNLVLSALEDIYTNKKDSILLSNLRLLRVNDGQSYAFSTRLLEYLLNNVITSEDTISNNIVVVNNHLGQTTGELIPESWSLQTQLNLFNEYMHLNIFRKEDINGFGDKDIEKYIFKNK